jgi:beta-glucosidase/6-phospho-beta-glucosidase/beta-galactosidase
MRFLLAILLCVASCAPSAQQQSGFVEAKFPSTWTWGTATAQWQVEGDQGVHGPVASNWSTWMKLGKAKAAQTNPDGNGFFTQFDGDIGRAHDLGVSAFRMSIDWARIEPQPGVFDDDELQHDKDIIASLKAHGIKPVVTLYHWTVPTWVQNPDPNAPVDLIATTDHAVVDDFEAFVRHVIPAIKDDVDTYTVMNEPLSMISAGYFDNTFPPGDFLDIPHATQFGVNLLYMHARAYDVIKELEPNAFVGTTMAANDVFPVHPDSQQEKLAATSIGYVYNDWFMQGLVDGDVDMDLNGTIDATDVHADPKLKGKIDFVGVQYYGPVDVIEQQLLDNFAPLYGQPLLDVSQYNSALPHNGMGREIRASDFSATLEHYAKWGIPMIVTENGTTTNGGEPPDSIDPTVPYETNDDQAAMYLVVHLWELGNAIKTKHLDVRGYFHWTLADNFEWVEGKRQHFGAYSVDWTKPDRPRTLNKMGEALRDVIKAGAVDETIWNKYVLPRFPSDKTQAGVGFTTSSSPLPVPPLKNE